MLLRNILLCALVALVSNSVLLRRLDSYGYTGVKLPALVHTL